MGSPCRGRRVRCPGRRGHRPAPAARSPGHARPARRGPATPRRPWRPAGGGWGARPGSGVGRFGGAGLWRLRWRWRWTGWWAARAVRRLNRSASAKVGSCRIAVQAEGSSGPAPSMVGCRLWRTAPARPPPNSRITVATAGASMAAVASRRAAGPAALPGAAGGVRGRVVGVIIGVLLARPGRPQRQGLRARRVPARQRRAGARGRRGAG